MTAQIDDVFRYRDVEYAVSGISEGELLDVAALGVEPVGTCTACYRGYQAVFGLSGDRLVLDGLHVSLGLGRRERLGEDDGRAPAIRGVRPKASERDFDIFDAHYETLEYPLAYSGGLLITDGFIKDLYVHMGFQDPWKHERVVELIFESGKLLWAHDRSEQMAEVRRRILEESAGGKSRGRPGGDAIREFIERSFDRSYRL